MAVVIVAAYEFFTSDDQALDKESRAMACAGRGARCHAALARFMKTPFFQERQFRVDGGATVDVRCTRTFYLVGEHHCAVR